MLSDIANSFLIWRIVYLTENGLSVDFAHYLDYATEQLTGC
ncbi:hypothetical protein GNIT_3336 [Glaciecola nitratireducens FR1064]|uniref:Uncharacterized protein n=1 Tax=Glaciecola nitratireducens (strain JCM 12485 / KCTC 12276 / FR1064) TaxID=1085623 RepID=G4QN12_GLANF|nr:hypothetical protein GNIT_3336 [Glaciecola nitratireducens FR1064]